jgi:CBS domain containing-hemolysin-like protein
MKTGIPHHCRPADGVFAAYPAAGEEVQVGDYLLKTLQIENHRVQKVQLIPLRDEEELDFEV